MTDALSELKEVIREPFALEREQAFEKWKNRWVIRLGMDRALGKFPYPEDRDRAMEVLKSNICREFSSVLPAVMTFAEFKLPKGHPDARVFDVQVSAYFYAFRSIPGKAHG